LHQKLFHLSKALSIATVFQVALQALAFASGILVIRLLPVHEYGLYTIANTVLGTIVMLADMGVSSGVMSQGGKVWKNPAALGAVLATGMALRRKFSFYSLLAGVPVLLYLFHKHEASWLASALLVVSLVPAFATTLSGPIFEIPLKLHQEIVPLQKIQISSNVLRLFLNSLALFVFPYAAIAVAIGGAAQFVTNIRLRSLSLNRADTSQPIDPVARGEILKIVRRSVPMGIYLSILNNSYLWLISIFGTTAAVAQVGALGRLAIVLSVFQGVFSSVIAPRFARFPDSPSRLARRYFAIEAVLLVLGILIVAAVWVYPNETLWVLGGNYSGLQTEVILMAAWGSIGLVRNGIFSLNSARGYIGNPWVIIPVNLAFVIAAYLIFPPVDTKSALCAALAGSIPGPFIQTLVFLTNFRTANHAARARPAP
jgi:O-antigen/teichoic acid export membrane protein